MANARAFVGRRMAIGNIRKITRTMELIATSRVRKALARVTGATPYATTIAELAADLGAAVGRKPPAPATAPGSEEPPAARDHRQPRAVRGLQRGHPACGDRPHSRDPG